MRARLAALGLVLAVLAACGEEQAEPAAEAEPSTSSSAAGAEPTPERDQPRSQRASNTGKPGTKIVARASDFGTVLFDDTGQAIYLFDVETTSEPRCYGACAEAWPPVVTEGTPRAGDQVDQSLLDTTERRNGDLQVAYDGHPLYFYAHEGKLEVKCHDIFLNGGTWYAVQPDGDRAP